MEWTAISSPISWLQCQGGVKASSMLVELLHATKLIEVLRVYWRAMGAAILDFVSSTIDLVHTEDS